MLFIINFYQDGMFIMNFKEKEKKQHFSELEVFKFLSERFNVIPISEKKFPVEGFRWKEYQCEKKDVPEEIYEASGYGVVCGEKSVIEGWYLFVVDFDSKAGHDDFFVQNSHLEAVFSNTINVRSYYGFHYYFLSKAPIKGKCNRNSYGGIDIKASGGYIAGAGSVRYVYAKEDKKLFVCQDTYSLINSDKKKLSLKKLDHESLSMMFDALNIKLEYKNNHDVNNLVLDKIKTKKRSNKKNVISKLNHVTTMYKKSGHNSQDFKSLKLKVDKFHDAMSHIGKVNLEVKKYLECKNPGYTVEDRSCYDYIAIKDLRNNGFSIDEVIQFFYRLNNPNVKGWLRLVKNSDSGYIESTVIKADKELEKLEYQRELNRKELEDMKSRFLKIDSKLLFKDKTVKMQAKLFKALLYFIDRTIYIGFAEGFFMTGFILSKSLGTSTGTAYNRIKTLVEYGYLILVKKGSFFTKTASKYDLNYEALMSLADFDADKADSNEIQICKESK